MQRVGVARALAADPPIILMDEPFGALDPITRQEMQEEFLELESEIKKTIIFVTHDIVEAVRMGDRIALLDGGRLQQLATPAELTAHPANDFVEEFLGRHRFQVSLLTRSVKSLTKKGLPERADSAFSKPQLRGHHSLLEALDILKRSELKSGPVYDGDTCIGILSKRRLLDEIMSVLEGDA
jgi:osmoprotectant transport system ATP-binding protein